MRIPFIDFKSNTFLVIAAGCLLGFSFPPSPFGSLAYVAFIPFFIVFHRSSSNRQLAWLSYLFVLAFHVTTVYWTGGFVHMKDTYMMLAGLALIIIHPVFYLPSILLSKMIHRTIGPLWGLTAFIFLWLTFEYLHSLGEFSFPWIVIGNSQAFDVKRIQIAEFTSSYGLSFLILSFNVLGFLWLVQTGAKRWRVGSLPSLATLIGLIVVHVGPWLYGNYQISRYLDRRPSVSLKIGIVQPNIDPWDKWGEKVTSRWDSYSQQMQRQLEGTRTLRQDSVDLVLWPETAIPFPVGVSNYSVLWQRLNSSVDSIGLPVFSGMAYVQFYDSTSAPITAHRIAGSQRYYEYYNAAALIGSEKPSGNTHKKIKLVPFAERIPYAETFRFLIEPLKWSVGISGWGLGKDTVVFELRSRARNVFRFAGMICYESVYPDFVREYVRRGAEFLVVITNDSWWGNTSGAYQHMAFNVFRAVENRRYVVQCANGGISGYCDPLGNIRNATALYTALQYSVKIEPRNETTFYARHGDIFGVCCTSIAGLFVLLGFSRAILWKESTHERSLH